MGQKIREISEMEWFGELQNKYNWKMDYQTATAAYKDIIEHCNPIPIRIDPALLREKLNESEEYIKSLEPGQTIDLRDLLVALELDPNLRSTQYHVRKMLNESNLLSHQHATKEQWMRLLNGPSDKTNGEAE